MTYPIAIGTVVSVMDQRACIKQYAVSSYDERMYMKIIDTKNSKVWITIHPEHASRIAANGCSHIKVLDTRTLNDIFVAMTDEVVIQPSPTISPRPTTIPTSSIVSGTKTKKQLALEIKAQHPHATRKELITMFIQQLGMTTAGASTYASMK